MRAFEGVKSHREFSRSDDIPSKSFPFGKFRVFTYTNFFLQCVTLGLEATAGAHDVAAYEIVGEVLMVSSYIRVCTTHFAQIIIMTQIFIAAQLF